MRLLALLSPCVLFACSSTTTVVGGPGPDSGTNPDGSSNDLDGASNPDGSSNPEGGGAEYCPAGYILTPFLSATATTHTYAKADQVLDSSKDYVAVLETTAGRIVWHLLSQDTPITTNSFIFLALHHYFDGIAFHRVIDGFVAQGGDPNTLGNNTATWGTGGPGYYFGLEVKSTLNFDSAGVVGMARTTDPNSNGSQFYITLAAASSLDGMYTVFANVTEGLDVLPKIVRGDPFTDPKLPTRMTDVHICQQ